MVEELMPNQKAMFKKKLMEGCGVLFKSGSGIIICGEARVDGNCFLCKRCLKEIEELTESKKKGEGK